MPRKAPAPQGAPGQEDSANLSFPPGQPGRAAKPGRFNPLEKRYLSDLQRQALAYFLENQLSHGLVLDRQRNHGPRLTDGLCSTAATGMGLMAIALATAPEYDLLAQREAIDRVRAALVTALEYLPSDHGIMPHFVDAQTLEAAGADWMSTIDSAWLAAGALWASAFLGDADLQEVAWRLYRRIDWRYWTGKPGKTAQDWLVHGKDSDGRFLSHAWDRLNAESAFMYVLAVGAAPEVSLPAASWRTLHSYYGTVAGLRFPSADLGLFVFQYSMELLDLQDYHLPGAFDLYAEARIATQANHEACRQAAERFRTYRDFWGLSAGDGPSGNNQTDAYRCYSPTEAIDGTAHLTATLASAGTWPELVWENIAAVGESALPIRGRYGYSNVNVDRQWVSRDVVGIDLGAVVLALDNCLHHGRVRRLFHQLDCVKQALRRLDAQRRTVASPAPERLRAS